MTAVDYSLFRPTVAQLQAAGVTAVGRYVGPWSKCITEAEAALYFAAGIDVWLVFEQGVDNYQGGAAQGHTDALLAVENLPSNFGTGTVIYFAVDASVNPPDAIAYFRGINEVLTAVRVGVYGEGALCQLLCDSGLASFFWQSESTAFPGNASTLPITNIQQVTAASPFGENADLDLIEKADFGQTPRPGGQVGDYPNAVSSVLTATGNGSWVVGSDGGVFCSGDAQFYGSMGGKQLAAPIVGITRSWSGNGYYLIGADGGVFAFGDAIEYGSYPGLPPASREGTRTFGTLAVDWGGGGYTLVALDGSRYHF